MLWPRIVFVDLQWGLCFDFVSRILINRPSFFWTFAIQPFALVFALVKCGASMVLFAYYLHQNRPGEDFWL